VISRSVTRITHVCVCALLLCLGANRGFIKRICVEVNGLHSLADTCLREGPTTDCSSRRPGPFLALQAWKSHLRRNSHMRRTLLFFVVLILAAIIFVACGGDKKPAVTVTKTNAFGFIQEVPNQSGTFIPMLGQYVTSGGTTMFQTAAPIDSSRHVVSGAFGSLYLSKKGDQVTFDLWGGLSDVVVDQWDIYVASADVSVVTQITNDVYEDYSPQLSADGTKVIYRSYRDTGSGGADVTVVKSATNPSAPEQVLPMPLGASGTYDATFSPDGSKIAVEAQGYNDVDGSFDGLVLMNADGSNPQLLTNPLAVCDCRDGYPAFTTDGTQIVYSGYTNTATGGVSDIYVINADGSGSPTVLTDGVGYNVDPLVVHIPGMADKVIFYSDRDNLSATGSTGFELYSINLDGSSLTRLTSNGVYDAFTQDWFASQTASAARMNARTRHGHTIERRSVPNAIRGLNW